MYPDWTRLVDFAKEVEARRSRPKPNCSTLCQYTRTDDWFDGFRRDQSFSNGGCFPLSSPCLDAGGWKAGACINTNKKLDREW